jgi:hypothetical protein
MPNKTDTDEAEGRENWWQQASCQQGGRVGYSFTLPATKRIQASATASVRREWAW